MNRVRHAAALPCLALAAILQSGCGAPGMGVPSSQPPSMARIGFGSCLRQNRPAPLLDFLADHPPDVFLFLGDNIYADTRDLDQIRAHYATLGRILAYRRLADNATVLATWDDHDYGENDAGSEFPIKAESAELFLDFFDVPRNSPRRRREGIYGEERIRLAGLEVQILLLDTRTFRSPLLKKVPPPAEGGHYVGRRGKTITILGDAQWTWLAEKLREPADLRIVASSIQVLAEEHNWEKWMNFPDEQQKLFDLIRETGANGVILVSGDRHHGEISMRMDAVGYPLIDITSSSLNVPLKNDRTEPNRYRRGPMVTTANAGWINIRNFSTDPEIQLLLLDETGRPAVSQIVRLSQLRPKQ